MDFATAGKYVIRFGQYKGRTIAKIAESDAGLLYLDRLLAWDRVWIDTRNAIETYLSDPSIAKELRSLLEAG